MVNLDETNQLIPWADDYEKVIQELRCKENPQHRIDAATVLLNDFNDPERIKFLLNAILYDPDLRVQEAVRKISSVELGNELQLALKIEASDGEPFEQPWLLDCILRTNLEEPQVNKELSAEIEDFHRRKDVPALMGALRDPLSIQKRVLAANVLGMIMDGEAAENLARAAVEDPDETVQQAALEALYRVLGEANAEQLLGEVMHQDFKEEWFLPTNEYELNTSIMPQNESPFGIRDSDVLHGLITIARGALNPNERIKAILQFTKYSDIRINETLAEIALFDGDSTVREEATEILKSRIGEDLLEFLEFIKNKAPYQESSSENEVLNNRSPGIPKIMPQPRVSKDVDQVIKEDKPPYYLLVILGAAFVLLLFFIFTLR